MDGTLQHLDGSAAAGAGLRPRLPAWKPDERAGKKPEGEWHDLPPAFIKALKTAVPFADTHPSAGAFMGVMLHEAHAYATCNSVLVEVECGGPVPEAVVPLALAQLLMKRRVPPTAMLASGGIVAFAWDDGTWIEFAFPHEVLAIVPAKFAEWREPEWEITTDWKEQYRAAAGTGGDRIVIGPTTISAGFGVSVVCCEAETPVEDETIWSPTVLAPVIELAERIDFTSHPTGGCFAFAGGRGLVACCR